MDTRRNGHNNPLHGHYFDACTLKGKPHAPLYNIPLFDVKWPSWPLRGLSHWLEILVRVKEPLFICIAELEISPQGPLYVHKRARSRNVGLFVFIFLI